MPGQRTSVRVAVVGGGVAGALLALRTVRAPGGARVDLYAAQPAARTDASQVSGGLVRGFEPDVAACRTAAESLAEIRGSDTLREWTGYTECGSVYVRSGGAASPAEPVAVLASLLPGSAEVIGRERLRRAYPFRGLPPDAVAVVERHAGHISPHRLRTAALAAGAASGVTVDPAPVREVGDGPAVRTADGRTKHYDLVVVAAGAWTPRLLARSGLGAGGLRTKHIQYSVCTAGPDGLGAFVDEISGLYGRPHGPGTFLLGLSSDRWDVDPDAVAPDTALGERVVERARSVLGGTVGAVALVAGCDGYHEPAGLLLRCVAPGIHTFAGGSGGAAKTVLSASRTAAAALLSG